MQRCSAIRTIPISGKWRSIASARMMRCAKNWLREGTNKPASYTWRNCAEGFLDLMVAGSRERSS